MTSPPFALLTKKEYGNVNQSDYIPWFCGFAREVLRVLTNDGSFVNDVGGAWESGRPTRSLGSTSHRSSTGTTPAKCQHPPSG